MATISKVLALPSATQYNPTSPPNFSSVSGPYIHDAIEYGQVAYGGTPTNKVGWQEPISSFYKNKTSSTYRFRLIRQSDEALIRDDILGYYISEGQNLQSSLGSGLVAGTQYRVEIYTSANGSTNYNSTPKYFYAMTAPDSSPQFREGYSGFGYSGYGNSFYGVENFEVYIGAHTVNWGGPASHISYSYYIDIVREDGTTVVSGYDFNATTRTVPFTLSVDLGPFDNGDYRIYVRAWNWAGSGPRVQNPSTQLYGPQNLPVLATPQITSIMPSSGSGYGGTSALIQGSYLRFPRSVTLVGKTATINGSDYDYIIITSGYNGSYSSSTGDLVVSNATQTATKTNAYTYEPIPFPNGNRCTSFDRLMGICPVLNCCTSGGSGNGCIPVNC